MAKRFLAGAVLAAVMGGALGAPGAVHAAQGLAAGDLAALQTALKKKSTYCNVHTDLFPGGEIRAQIK
jgi:hypothetical protein